MYRLYTNYFISSSIFVRYKHSYYTKYLVNVGKYLTTFSDIVREDLS